MSTLPNPFQTLVDWLPTMAPITQFNLNTRPFRDLADTGFETGAATIFPANFFQAQADNLILKFLVQIAYREGPANYHDLPFDTYYRLYAGLLFAAKYDPPCGFKFDQLQPNPPIAVEPEVVEGQRLNGVYNMILSLQFEFWLPLDDYLENFPLFPVNKMDVGLWNQPLPSKLGDEQANLDKLITWENLQ